jgi:hypothetical protein
VLLLVSLAFMTVAHWPLGQVGMVVARFSLSVGRSAAAVPGCLYIVVLCCCCIGSIVVYERIGHDNASCVGSKLDLDLLLKLQARSRSRSLSKGSGSAGTNEWWTRIIKSPQNTICW